MFGLNRVDLIGRLGANVEVRTLPGGGRVANFSMATDESYRDRNTGERVEKAEWHRVVSFQDGLVEILQKHGTKGRLVFISGKLQTRKWQTQDGSDRYSTEILLAPGSRVQFLEWPERTGDAAGDAAAQPQQPAGAGGELDDEIPF